MTTLRPTDQHPAREVLHIEVAAGYRPALATVRAGVPIRIVFHRIDDDPCTDRVIFSEPRIERRLRVHVPTTVDLPARSEGEIRYTCGMGRYSGTILVATAPERRLGRVRRELAATSNAATVALIIVAVGLPILAALSLVFLDGGTTFIITALATIAAAAALLWVVGIPSLRRGMSGVSGPTDGREADLAGTPRRPR